MNIRVSFGNTGQKIATQFAETSKDIGANLGVIQVVKEYVGGELYDGEYTVIPKVEAQTIPTKEKVMVDDVTIKAIPYAEVTNNTGGKTATIGGN